MTTLTSILLASVAASLVSFSGGVLAIFNEERMRRATHYIVSFAVGALFAVSFLHLIPEAAEMGSLDRVLPFVLGGILLFFLLEKFIFWYHCHGEKECPIHPYSYLILWGDFIHNFVDGIILALAFIADARLGFVTAIAVIMHEIPQEISDFGLLVHGGLTRGKALFYNFLSALSVIAGGLLAYWAGSYLEPYLPEGLALVAGAFIYLAAVVLFPELHESSNISHTFAQLFFILVGVVLVTLPEFFIG